MLKMVFLEESKHILDKLYVDDEYLEIDLFKRIKKGKFLF